MKHFDKGQIAQLRTAAQELYTLANEADTWVNTNLTREEFSKASLAVRDIRRIVRKVVNSIDSKPVFALFGASQVGKSYLIKNILSVDGKPLEISFGDTRLDFLRDINPPGVGAESTGVVTRFTTSMQSPFPDFPVKSRLLLPKDIVLILCDSFFSDQKQIDSYPQEEDFKALIQNIKLRYNGSTYVQKFLADDDLYDIREYYQKHFGKYHFLIKGLEASDFWGGISEFIHRMSPPEWSDAFSILWNHNPSYTLLFKKLISGIQAVDFKNEVYIGVDTIKREGGQILDVLRLKNLFTDKVEIGVLDTNGNRFSISTSLLSALSAEITLPCGEEIVQFKPFFQNTDLLDFPGARSRLELSDRSITDDVIPDLLLRGKVSYLFNKYSSDFEINNLLFCQNDKQLDVNELPTLLHEWISNNIGGNADERQANIADLPVSPLFIIFTFFNNQLKFDVTNDDKDVNYKWDTRFDRFFAQELVSANYNWHTNWTNSIPNFTNFYLLRDFKYSDDTFFGFVDSGREQGVERNRIEFLSTLRQSFLGHPFVQKHFTKPEESFEAVSEPNMDGSRAIIKSLEPAANNFVKTRNYITILENKRSEFTRALSKHFYSDDLSEMRKKAIANSIAVNLELNRLFSRKPDHFSVFIRHFLLNEDEVYNYLHDSLPGSFTSEIVKNEYEMFRSGFKNLDLNKGREYNLNIIASSWGLGGIEEVIHVLEEQGLNLDILFPIDRGAHGSGMVDGLIQLWLEKSSEDKISSFIEQGISYKTIELIRNTLLQTMERNDFKAFLGLEIKERSKGITIARQHEEYLAAFITAAFNEFVSNAGLNWLSKEVILNVKTLLPQLEEFIDGYFEPPSYPVPNDLVSLFDDNNTDLVSPMIDGYNSFLSKFKVALLSNCGFSTYDVHQNNLLNSLLERNKVLQFNM
jgi:hypothetical protein